MNEGFSIFIYPLFGRAEIFNLRLLAEGVLLLPPILFFVGYYMIAAIFNSFCNLCQIGFRGIEPYKGC